MDTESSSGLLSGILWFVQGLFYAGPSLGGRLRGGPFGDHARVARVGLRHGLALGVATQRQLRALASARPPAQPPAPRAVRPAARPATEA